MGKAEEHIELRSPSYPSSSAPSSSIIKNPSYTVPKTILSPQPIRDNPQYTKAVRQERALIILILLIIVILGPLVFRYCLGCQTDSSDESSPTWGQNLDPFEIYILLAVFSNMTGSIIRILPAVCGGPATIESVKTIQLEGQVSLCIVTPFCAEGDEMLLRNLLGRTCTLFHTVSSRHTLQGLYVDVTMNERRLKGEANRKKLFYEWMGFLTTLIKICQKKEKLKLLSTEKNDEVLSSEKDTTLTSSLPNEQLPSSEPGKPIVYANKYSENITNFQSRFHSFRKYGENVFDMGRDASTFDFAPSVVIDNRNSIQLRNTRRQSTVATTASPSLIHENPLPIVENTISPSPLPRESPQTHTNNHLNHLQMYPNGLSDRLAGDRDITNAAVLNGLVVNLESIEPVINFFDQWLAEMKLNERIYHYGDKNESLDRLFLAAPFIDHFVGEELLAVHTALDRLYTAFTSNVPDDPDTTKPIYPDDVQEVEWIVKRNNSPDWTVVWSLIGRSKLKPMSQHDIGDVSSPPPLFDVIRIIPGAIVYCKSQFSSGSKTAQSLFIDRYLDFRFFFIFTRETTYKVVRMRHEAGICLCDLTPFPPSQSIPDLTKPLAELALIEMNRGKAGALNFCNEYFRCKTIDWATKLQISPHIQTLVGIIDARHALVEPHIFWNDALPFFSSQKNTLAHSRSYGFKKSSQYPVCITVQYPQHFSNVGHDDYLDNANSAYYNIWQPLRDCGKCVTSSGTNTIWEISDPDFLFCTDSRSEDLGTSHKYISESVAVYLCTYVAYGIAKKTEDYLEALYRWAAGPLELMWLSLFEPYMLWHYFIVLIPSLLLLLACFSPLSVWYYLHLGMVGTFLLIMINDKYHHRKPLRKFVVATVICSNLFGWIGTFFSLTWVFVLPFRIVVFGEVPFLKGQRWFFWGLVTLIFGLPLTIFKDSMIRMSRLASADVRKINLYKALWRGSQLYACSFAFNIMAILAGTYSAFKAWWFKRDLSLWSSFRVSGNEIDKSWNRVLNAQGFVYWNELFRHILVKIKYYISLTTIPTEMTKWYLTFLFICQIIFVLSTVVSTGYHSYSGIIVVVSSGFVNMCLIYQVAFLLQPNLRYLGGFPIRAEILYAYIGVAMAIALVFNKSLSWQDFSKALHL